MADDFRMLRSMIDVTSLSRPNLNWRYTDVAGHEHRWHVKGIVATIYDPRETYETPTLIWVKDGEEYWEDDDQPPEVGHLECKTCGEHVEPGRCPDDYVQYIPGLLRWEINGQTVSREEYVRCWNAANPQHPI